MPHDLARLVIIRELRKQRAERELRLEREALRQAQAKVETDRQALRDLEQNARAQQQDLCVGRRLAGDAFAALDFVAAQHLQSKQVRLRMHRSSAEAGLVSQRVDAAHDTWRSKARAHEALKLQDDMLRKRTEHALLALVEEVMAEEHTDAWITRNLPQGNQRHGA